MPEQQTRVLADRYELITPIGRGTMGTVWRAHDRSLGREVAIKEIRQDPGLSEDQRAELRERMIREGRTAARISHPSVATVHDAIVEDGSPWIIMELVPSRSLEQVIDQEGPLPPRLVAEIGVDLLDALRAAHSQGVLHRDVKPANVLITESGRVVLTDFGIAKAEGDSSLTKTGMVIGSPGYTAPERARGEHTGPESDLWSLGATLYFAVEGRPAYERSSVSATLAALMTERADPPTQAGPLRPVLEQLLERDHRLRPSPTQAIAMLRTVADTPTATPSATTSATASATAEPAVPGRSAASGASGASSRPAPPGAPAGTPKEPEGPEEEVDGDRTVLVIRPKGGLRLPPGPGVPAPAAPPMPPMPPVSPASSESLLAPASPVSEATAVFAPAASRAPARPGRPVAGRPAGTAVPPRPAAGSVGTVVDAPAGAAPYGPPGQPEPRGGWPGAPAGEPSSRGLGTDLFAISGQGGREGRAGSPLKGRVGMLVLVGVAAVSLVVIVILAVAAFAEGGGPRASASFPADVRAVGAPSTPAATPVPTAMPVPTASAPREA